MPTMDSSSTSRPSASQDAPYLIPSAHPLASVVIAYSVVDSWERGLAHELIVDAETEETASAIAQGLTKLGYHAPLLPVRKLSDLDYGLAPYSTHNTVVFNLCEALGGISGGENEVPAHLEHLGFGYVGGDTENLTRCLDKIQTKEQLAATNLPTAKSQRFVTGNEPICLDFPVLIKTQFEDCSVGITPNSLVWDEASLRQQVATIHRTYHQPAFAEQFLRGREFYVSLWDDEQATPHVLAIAQADYSSAPDPTLAFDHFEAKWQNTYPALYPAPISDTLAATIANTARAAYQTMKCRDYARIDLREDGDTIYILEVNPNPALHPDAGFAKAARIAGYSYCYMAAYLTQLAWRRREISE